MKNIEALKFELPHFSPIMVLPGISLFPRALLPLYIFEPRYREMLEWALGKQRMFSIASLVNSVTEGAQPDHFRHVMGLGLIRACRTNADGTSNLVLQGIARVRVISLTQSKPFRIAEIGACPLEGAGNEKVAPLMAKVAKVCSQLQPVDAGIVTGFEESLERIEDPELLTDVVANAYLLGQERRQEVFEESDAEARLRILLRYLEGQADGVANDE